MKKGIRINKNNIISLQGIIICLFSLVIVFSQKSIFSFLSTGILAAFGFIGFWILVPILFIWGIYLTFRTFLKKHRMDISMWGAFILFIALLVLTSAYGTEGYKLSDGITLSMFNTAEGYDYLKFNNSIGYFNEIAGFTSDEISTKLVLSNVHLGGGYVGFILCGLLNNGITPLGTLILSWIIASIGILLILNRQIKAGFLLIKNRKRKAKKEEENDNEEDNNPLSLTEHEEISDMYSNLDSIIIEDKEEDLISLPPMVETISPHENLNTLSLRNFNNTHGLKKPVLDIDGNENKNINFNNVLSSINEEIEQENPTNIENNTYVEQEENNYNDFSNCSINDINNTNNEINEDDYSNTSSINNSDDSRETFTPINEEHSIQEESLIQEKKPHMVYAETIVDPTKRGQPKATIKPPYKLPPIELLQFHENDDDLAKNDVSSIARLEILNKAFSDFNIGAEAISYKTGPSVTRYNVKFKPNVSVSSLNRIVNDLSVRLCGVPVRYEPIVFGVDTSGIEVQNEVRINVGLRESIAKLPVGEKFIYNIPFGKDISGDLLNASITKFPHMLVAGSTGSGKSIFMQCCLITLLMRTTPYELKLMLIDPKKVEMNYYENIPHLLCPIITEAKKAVVALRKLVDEMERRYNLFVNCRVRDFGEFNVYAKKEGLEPLPLIIVFFDEYADINEECKEIKEPVVRIAAKARAAGIHLVIATQRPSVNVIDGVIKANISTHVALRVANFTDSSTILGEGGAEKLLGNGDMIIDCAAVVAGVKPRVQGCYVSPEEITAVVDYIKKQSAPLYDPEFLDLTDHSHDDDVNDEGVSYDPSAAKELSEEQLYETIKSDIQSKEYCSISYIQRTYGVGFPKAGRLFNKLVKDGLVANKGDARGCKVLIKNEQSESPVSSDESKVYVNDEGEN